MCKKKLRAPRRADEEGKVGNLILRLCAGGAAVAASLVGYRLVIACLCVLRANTNPVHSSSGQICTNMPRDLGCRTCRGRFLCAWGMARHVFCQRPGEQTESEPSVRAGSEGGGVKARAATTSGRGPSFRLGLAAVFLWRGVSGNRGDLYK